MQSDNKKVLKMAETIISILLVLFILKFRNYVWMPTLLIFLAYAKWKIADPIVLQIKLWRYNPREAVSSSSEQRLLRTGDTSLKRFD
jgi:hypothetical protein